MDAIEALLEATNKFGITAEQLLDNLDGLTVAMLTIMAKEMISCGRASFGNGTFVNIGGELTNIFGDVIGELKPSDKFLEIYNNLLLEKGKKE